MPKAVLKVEADVRKMLFSRAHCFRRGLGEEERRCLAALIGHLEKQPVPLVFYGAGDLCRFILENSEAARRLVKAIADDDPSLQGSDVCGVPVMSRSEATSGVRTVFLAATKWLTLHRMRKRLPADRNVLTLDVVKDAAPSSVPQHAWVTHLHSIYPIGIPEIEITPGLDMLLLDVPARYVSEMPIGLCYVHNALKKAKVRHQTLDFSMILYHRFHTHRVLDGVHEARTDTGYRVPDDPWETLNFEEWHNSEFLAYFQPDVDELVGKVAAAKPKVVGISIQQINRTLVSRIVASIRERHPEAVILVGGMACADHRVAWGVLPETDYMCIGEADLTVGPLVEALARGERPRDLPGVLSRFDSPDHTWEDGPIPTDLDTLDPPRYDWADIQLYRNWNDETVVPLVASRGCHWGRCRFCNEPYRFRGRSPMAVVEEIKWFHDRGFKRFVFHDSDCNGDPGGLMEMCREIKRGGMQVSLSGQMRIAKTGTPEFFHTLRQGGFTFIRFGVDGWSDNALRIQRKGYNKRLITENLKNCKQAGICTHVNCVVGVPGETEEDVDEAIAFLIENKPHYNQLAYCHPLMLLVGSDFWEAPEKYNIRFRSDPEQLYKETLIIPDEQWYSEDPYVDGEVRKSRLLRVLSALRDAGVNIGSYVEYVEKAVRERGSFRALQDREETPGTEQPTRRVAVQAGGRTTRPGIALFRHAGEVYGLPLDKGCLNVTDCVMGRRGAQLIRLLGAHKGYNILQYGDVYYGLPIRLGHIDIRRKEDRTKPGIFACERPERVVEIINQIVNSRAEVPTPGSTECEAPPALDQPIIIHEDHDGYVVFCHGAGFYAVSREVRMAELSQMDDRGLDVLRAKRLLLEASSLDSVQRQINEAEGDAAARAKPRALVLCCAPRGPVVQLVEGLKDCDLTLLVPPDQRTCWPEHETIVHRNAAGQPSPLFDAVDIHAGELAALKSRGFETAFIVYADRMLWRRGRLPERLAAAVTKRIEVLFADGRRCVYEGDDDMNRIVYNRAYLDNLLRHVPSLEGKAVLEVGCSDGLACDLMVQEGAERVVGVDVCKSPGERFRHPKIAYRRMSADALEFADDMFHVTFSIAMLEHCQDPRKAIEEMLRVTRPGGILYLQTAPLYYSPFGHHMFEYFDDYPWIHLRLTPEEIIAEAKRRGLAGRIRAERSQDIEDFIRGMLSREHVNMRKLREYELPEVVEENDVDVLFLHRSTEGENLLSEQIIAELPGIPPRDLVTHGIELVLRKGVPSAPTELTRRFAEILDGAYALNPDQIPAEDGRDAAVCEVAARADR